MDEIILLNRVRVDIGNVSGPLSELMQYATLKGFNDNYEPLEKPRLVGTWTVNNYTSLYLLDLSRSLFDGLTINCSSEWIIDFNDLAVLTLDSTQPNYNPAAAIILCNHNVGILLDGPVIYNQNGRWFLTKAQASLISSIGKWFLSATTVIDNDKICGLSADSYNFTGFNEFEYFTGTGSSLTEGTFSGCTLLLTIKLPSNITTLNTNSNHATSGTFSNCTSLDVPVTVFNNITYIDNAYEHVSSGHNYINSGCFNNCLSLKWQTLPPNLTYIGYCAFNNCNNLLLNCTLNFVTQVRMKAFSGCSKIIYIELPSVTYLSYYAFAECTLLTEVQLPESLNLIKEGAFLNCSNLNIDHLPNNLVTLELNAFFNCSSLTLSTLPLTLQTVGNRAFLNCALSVSSLPSSLINIYDWAFGNQTNMNLGDHISCNVIGNHAFYGVNFPSNLTISTLELETIHVALGWPSPAISSDFITLNNVTKIGTTVPSQYNIFKSTSIVHITVDTPPNLIGPGFLNVAKIYIGNGVLSHDESVIDDYAIASNWSTLKLLPWYLYEHTPALQSYDSSAPNYYPALCICFEQAGYGRYITTNNKTKGWYMSDEEAASITDTGNVLKDKSIITDVNGICGTVGATYILTSADLSSFTNIESIDLSGSIQISNVTIAQNSPLSKYKLPTVKNVEYCDWRNSGGWIYNNGAAYIDTGVIFSAANTKIDMSLEIINNNDNNTTKGFIGTNNESWNWSGLIGGIAAGKVFLGSGSAIYPIENISLNQQYNIIYDKKSIYLENTLKGTCSGSDDYNNIIIFSRGTSHTSNSFRFYYIKIWNNDTLVREMYPAIDSNDVVCMYDYVSNLYFYNQGSDNFTVSQEVIAARVAPFQLSLIGLPNLDEWDDENETGLNYGVPSKILSLTFSNCPNINSIKLLSKIASAQDTLLNTVNVTTPDTNGPIEDLISIAALWNGQSGENSNLKISGNYIVNNTFITIAQCNAIGYNPNGDTTQMSTKIYGLIVTIDQGTYPILQSYDSNEIGYNPAVCICFEQAGYGSYIDDSDKTKGWYLTKTQAESIDIGSTFYRKTNATDVNGICGTVDAVYNFTTFHEFVYFKSVIWLSSNSNNKPRAAFQGCPLSGITIPDSVLYIDQSWVEWSSLLQNGNIFDFPPSILKVFTYAFLGNIGNVDFSVIFRSIVPPILYSNAFISVPNKIYVPANLVETYKTATGWSEYANIIEAIPSEYLNN